MTFIYSQYILERVDTIPARTLSNDLTFSPVHSALKFSAVFGTVEPKRPITILPLSDPSTSTSKNTYNNDCKGESF